MKDITIAKEEIDDIDTLSSRLIDKIWDTEDGIAGGVGGSGLSGGAPYQEGVVYYNQLSMIITRLKMIQGELLKKIQKSYPNK